MISGLTIIVFITILVVTNSSDMRFLQNTSLEIKNTTVTIPLFVMPKCVSDSDCSMNGYCQMKTGQCHCSQGYQTFISSLRLLELEKKYEFSSKDNKYFNNSLNWEVINLTIEDVKFCNYQQKKQLTAFLLSLLVGFGTEHFYMGNLKVAAAKFVFYSFCGVLNIIYFIFYNCIKNGKKYTEFIGTYEAFYLSCGFLYVILWTVYDLVHIGYNNFTDVYGFELMPWNSTAG